MPLRSNLTKFFLLFTLVSSDVWAEESAEEPSAQQVQFFEAKIRPVLVKQCYSCHSSDAKIVRGGLLLDSKAGVLAGGDSGPAVVPGKVKASLLLSAIRHDEFEMPPKGKLPDSVIADFTKWVEMGAPDPRTSRGLVAKEIDIEKGREFWAFQPVKSYRPPQVNDRNWPRDDIDRFVLAKLEAKGIAPQKEADRRTLIRRLYFDLIGLPPTPEQVRAFVEDDSPRALANVVDELLASQEFGRRWGRHWLDVARYGESNGNVRNAIFPNAWRYRDWVIDAFNEDKPWDRFIIEQIAGDLLPAEDQQERNRNLTATGFLAIGSKPNAGGNPNFKMDIVADQIDVVGKGFMGLTVSCARCHDHKFDPIPTRDYYAMAGIFASTETLYGGGGKGNMGGAPVTKLHDLIQGESQAAQIEAAKKEYNKLQKELTALQTEAKKIRRLKDVASRQRRSELQKEIKLLTAKLKAKPMPTGDQAMGVQESNKIADARVNIRGEARSLGDSVDRGYLQVILADENPEINSANSGRLELAQWMTQPSHPLTARVAVNRVWHQMFGRGIVASTDNFGLHGDRPTHPELLDYLATEFMEDGWSIKRLVRRLALTRAYAMSSEYDADRYEADPENLLLWRMRSRRLEAEAIRDSMLTVSGQIDLSYPGASMVSKENGLLQDGLLASKFHAPNPHRSVFQPILRNGLPDYLLAFDFADPSLVVGKRNSTTVPAQALFLMNSKLATAQAEHFAERVLAEADDEPSRVKYAYQLALQREPTENELDRALKFIKTCEAETAWPAFCQSLFVVSEFRHID